MFSEPRKALLARNTGHLAAGLIHHMRSLSHFVLVIASDIQLLRWHDIQQEVKVNWDQTEGVWTLQHNWRSGKGRIVSIRSWLALTVDIESRCGRWRNCAALVSDGSMYGCVSLPFPHLRPLKHVLAWATVGRFMPNILPPQVRNESSGELFMFPCDNWLDSGEGDKKIERQLQAGVGEIGVQPAAPDAACRYKVTVFTSNKFGAGMRALVLKACGYEATLTYSSDG